jgi:hypothetical protein
MNDSAKILSTIFVNAKFMFSNVLIRWNNVCVLWIGPVWEACRYYSGLYYNFLYKHGVSYYID